MNALCDDFEPRMGRDGRWRWDDADGNRYRCLRTAVKRLTRAAYPNVLGDTVPAYSMQFCSLHWSEALEGERGITVEVIGQLELFPVGAA